MQMFYSILITGGTGSFGQAFTKFLLANTSIPRICIYSRGEHTQASMRLALGDDPRLRWMIGDVRDLPRLKRAMRGVQVVVHAAALKRIETGAYNPEEMTKTNVLGTMNVVEAACGAASVELVLGLSSDKAFQPVSPYGHSKALAEGMLLAANRTHGGPRFMAARYGNIWCAQGSVVPKWRELAAQGSTTIPITNADCTRFFMTLDDAVDLVWGMLTGSTYSELVIPDWLPAYRLGDLAEAMNLQMRLQGTGLPAWEKLHESMDFNLSSDKARRMTVDELRGWLNHG